MPIRSSSMGGTPFGNTANRPSSPQVGQTYYNGELGYLEIYTSAGWTSATKAIPYGNTANRPANPAIGQPYFNGQESRLELYTSGTGWQNIVQETPSVVSITGQLNETTTSTIQINGTNFAAGAVAYIVGTNGVEVSANTTTIVSVVEISAVFPAANPANGPYDVKVVNPSNLYGVLYETLSVNDQPIWSTSAGSLGTFTELQSVSVTVAATDTSDSTNSAISYSVVSGALPGGLTLNSSTGVISGTASNVIPNTTYSFTIAATDSRNTAITRAFSITINDRSPSWTTGTTLPTFTRNSAYSTTVAATEDDSGAITYSLISGSLPTGLSLSSSGVISGTPTSSTTATFTLRATVTDSGNTTDRTFTMPNAGPVWSTSGTLSAILNGAVYSQQITATDDSGVAPTYSLVSGTLPTGISLSSSGLISGTASGITGFTNTNFTFRATDANGTSADQTLTIPINEGIYSFTSHTFTNAGQTGRTGPSLAQVQSSYSSASWAQNTSYLNTSNGIQLWTVPRSGTYRITAAGARGGFSDDGPGGNTRPGYGATMAGDFSLTAGEIIKILVGQAGAPLNDPGAGSNPGGGGGGGSYVVKNDNTPILVAGGGNGENWTSWNTSGPDALTTNNGTGGGAGGGRCGGGGGFSGNGGGPTDELGSTGGLSFLNGGTGGQADPSTASGTNHGGFGGGGGAKHEGGGGGGYTGGQGVATNAYNTSYSSYGAGSYNIGTNQSNSGGSNNGYGYVTIARL